MIDFKLAGVVSQIASVIKGKLSGHLRDKSEDHARTLIRRALYSELKRSEGEPCRVCGAMATKGSDGDETPGRTNDDAADKQ